MSSNNLATNPSLAGARRRLKLLLFVVVIFMSWATYVLFAQYGKINASSGRLKEADQKLSEVQAESHALEQEIIRLNDDEYISQIARKEQGLGFPGETPIQFDKVDP